SPSFVVKVVPEAHDVLVGMPLRAVIEARTNTGEAIAEGLVAWTLSASVEVGRNRMAPAVGATSPSGAYPENRAGVQAAGGGTWSGREIATTGTGLLDRDGRYMVDLPDGIGAGSWSQGRLQDEPRVWAIEAVVTDDTGLTARSSAVLVLHQAEYSVEMRPESAVVRAGERGAFRLTVADWHGGGVPDTDVHVALLRRTWPASAIDATQPYSDTPVSEQTVSTDRNGIASVSFRLPQSGAYVAIATTTDPSGRRVTAESVAWAGAGADRISPWQAGAPLHLVADAAAYRVGDVAKVLVPLADAGSYPVLVTVEREGILWTRTTIVSGPNPIIEVPIGDSFSPTAFVFCAAIMPGAEAPGTEPGETRALPAGDRITVGYAKLAVTADESSLRVDVRPDRASYEPGEQARLAVSVKDAEGRPQLAEVTVVVTGPAGRGSVQASGPTVWQEFFGPRSLRVITGASLLRVVDLTYALGGGGDALMREGAVLGPSSGGTDPYQDALGPRIAADNQPVSVFFGAPLSTDDQGQLELVVDLPPTMADWTVRAWAITPDTRIGETSETLRVTKPLSIEPLAPAFLVAGDRAALAAMVRNSTEEPLIVDVTLTVGAPLRLESPQTQRVPVAPGKQHRVAWMVTAETVSSASPAVAYSARSGAYSDTSLPRSLVLGQGLLPVRGLATRDFAVRAGMLGDAETHVETIMIEPDRGTDDGSHSDQSAVAESGTEVVLRVDSTLTSIILSGLEQAALPETVHSMDGWINALVATATANSVRNLFGSSPIEITAAQAAAPLRLEQVYAQQNTDGGWGWRQSASNLQMTTYVVHGLHLAEQAGLAVRAAVKADGLAYISGALAREIGSGLRHPYQAFAMSVLAEAQGAWPQGVGAALYAERDTIGVAGRAYLALAFGALDNADTRLVSLLAELRSRATVTSVGVHWEDLDPQSWVTSAQATALVLKVLSRYAADDALVPGIVSWLVASRDAHQAPMGYESAWVHSALADYVLVRGDPGPHFDWRIILNGVTVAETAALESGCKSVFL
ncbi:MAG: hypothetical protein MUF84_20450, partial [Anaerolineae bacterium]|nr:hypothetical protein [Anaerolineae bacterium]